MTLDFRWESEDANGTTVKQYPNYPDQGIENKFSLIQNPAKFRIISKDDAKTYQVDLTTGIFDLAGTMADGIASQSYELIFRRRTTSRMDEKGLRPFKYIFLIGYKTAEDTLKILRVESNYIAKLDDVPPQLDYLKEPEYISYFVDKI